MLERSIIRFVRCGSWGYISWCICCWFLDCCLGGVERLEYLSLAFWSYLLLSLLGRGKIQLIQLKSSLKLSSQRLSRRPSCVSPSGQRLSLSLLSQSPLRFLWMFQQLKTEISSSAKHLSMHSSPSSWIISPRFPGLSPLLLAVCNFPSISFPSSNQTSIHILSPSTLYLP